MRDKFSPKTKDSLAKRVNYHCSNPSCFKMTLGPHSVDSKFINVGVAAHITAASRGGMRYDNTLTPDERKSIENGIWLCQKCSKTIDSDKKKFTTGILKN